MSIEGRPDRDRSIATIHAALDAGVTLIDTADAYHLHADEVGPQRDASSPRRCSPGAATPPRCSSPPRAATCAPATARGRIDGSPSTCARRARRRCKRLGVEAIGLYQFHRPDPACPTPSRSARSASCSTRARSRWPASPTPTRSRSGRPRRSSAAGWSACRTSSRRPSAAASRSSRCATSWASRSCRGARSAASARPASSAPPTRRSRRSPTRTGSARSRWPWPGCWPRRRSSIPIPGASRPETIRDSAAAAELELTADELQRLSTTG